MVVAQEARAARIGVEILRPGRQRGRCRGRDRLCAGGDLSARRQYRRRRLHGDPPRARRNVDTAIDYRETAPAATTRDIFLDEQRRGRSAASRATPALAIGVPGTVAGLALAHAKYGSGQFTLAQLIAPAIALAREGIPIEDDVADSLPRVAGAAGALAVLGEDLPQRDGSALAPGDDAGAARSRRHARRDRARRPARVLRGRDRRQARRRGARGRRHR